MTVRLTPPPARSELPALDVDQEAMVEAAAGGSGHVVVVGAAGAGKTTAVAAAAARAVARGIAPERLLVLAPTRMAAAQLRDVVSTAVGRPTGVPVVRTAASVGHAILSAAAHADGQPEPALITGAEQDAILRDLLEGHRLGTVAGPDWAGVVPADATVLPGFRSELRDVIMRATEAGLEPDGLEALAARTARPEWAAVAHIMREYQGTLVYRTLPGDQGMKYDPASAARDAAVALDTWTSARGRRPEWDLVIVDDYQDATDAVVALLDAMAHGGARLMLVGNADESVQGYRGALPSALAEATRDAGPRAFGARVMRLNGSHRQPAALSGVVDAVVARIGTQGVGSARGPAEAVVDAPVELVVAPHRYAQSRAVAAALRRARHPESGDSVQWSRMAVIARSNTQLRELRADLLGADIPCESLGEAVALHQTNAVAPLVTMMRVAAGEPWTEETALAVLGSRLVGLDPVGLRRLRRALMREERAHDGLRSSAELLVDAMESSSRWGSLDGREAGAAARTVAAVESARALVQDGAAPRRVIWALWTALDVADTWRAAALAGSARDDADLDAVIALLRAAQNFEERMGSAPLGAFVEHLESQDFAADSLGARAQGVDAVALVTPASAAGREWDVVVVAGLEEGSWPNLRLRDSVLGAQHLAQILSYRAEPEPLTAERRTVLASAARTTVVDDETRAFAVAASRARTRLILTCVQDAESRPSRYIEWVEHAASVPRVEAGTVPHIGDLRHAVATLRARGAVAEDQERHGYALALARLARRGVPGASPHQWHGVPEPSSVEGFYPEDAAVRVSPSKVEGVERCSLRWALETAGGTSMSSSKQQLGTLVHEIAAEYPRGTRDELMAALDERWPQIAGTETLPDRALRERAEAMITRLAAYIVTHPAEALSVEKGFSVEIGRARLSGSADRIEVDNEGRAVIVDLKTGSASYVGDVETHAQLSMYQLAAAHGAFTGIDAVDGAALAFLGGDTVKPKVVRQEQIDVDEQRDRLDAVVTRMSAPTFVATENDMCGMCPVRHVCPVQPEGKQVSDG